ncbi:cytochrome P450 [Dactylosporangium sp. NPDC000555]|uniref:cytochrome P450 n=1 Tax=Dactylosporangium sp. NPDC000555 TaxID=3154260 RepID=UPI00332DE656
MRRHGAPVWEEKTGAWVVADFDAAKRVLLDRDAFLPIAPAEAVPDQKYVRIFGEKHPSALLGAEHAEHHKWWLKHLSPKLIAGWRTGLILDVVDEIIGRIAPRGRAELVDEFAGPVPIRVIAGVLGLPWDDDAWMEELRHHLDVIDQFKDISYVGSQDSSMADQALDATYAADELLRPYLEAGRSVESESVLSQIWRDPSLSHWTDEQLYCLVRGFFGGGAETTRSALSNGLYLALTRPGLRDELQAGGERAMAAFVEETMRLFGTVHYRTRRVAHDLELDGVELKAGAMIASIMAAGDRDPERFERPDEVDLGRANGRQHLAFGIGVAACAGAGLARAELTVGMSRILERLPDIALDPDAEQPQLLGFGFRVMRPIHVTFSPGA